MIILLLIILVMLIITNSAFKKNENFLNIDKNNDIKIIKPGDPKFNYFEYEFNFSDFKTDNNNYLLTAKSNLSNLGYIYNEGIILILYDDMIYIKNNKNEWYFLNKDNLYNLYFWEPIVNKTDIQKLNLIIK